MFFIIYKVTNNINKKIYIGKHQTENIDDGYMGSGKAISFAIKKYKKENFTKEILFIFDNEHEMNKKEKELITEEFVKRKDTYNMGVGGEGGPHFKGKQHSEKTKLKISNSCKGRIISIVTKNKLSKAFKGRTFNKEWRQKLSIKAKNRYKSKKSREIMSKKIKQYYKKLRSKDSNLDL